MATAPIGKKYMAAAKIVSVAGTLRSEPKNSVKAATHALSTPRAAAWRHNAGGPTNKSNNGSP